MRVSLYTLPLLLLVLVLSSPASAAAPQPPPVAADSYVLMDFETGQLLASAEPHTSVEPASIVKVMTAMVAFDELRKGHVKLEDEVLISEKAWRSEGSRSFVEVGRRVRFEDLLHGIIIQSGNDASIAVAEHIAGDETVFAQLMNQHAQRIGMKNTVFTNASGLPHPDMRSTAYDIALMSQALIREFPEQYAWFKDREFVYNNIRQANRNRLLFEDSSVDGIKTGHTNAAGYCLAASAVRDGRRLITVVMGTASPRVRTQVSRALLEYGYRFFDTARYFGAEQPVQLLPAYKGAQAELAVGTLMPIAVSLPRNSASQVKIETTLNQPYAEAPVRRGEVLGRVELKLDGETLRSEPVVALDDLPLGSIWQRAADTLRLWLVG
jgi:serine-type D-Ala-D-Ala carboxypeptidase (penicillin-binding protein 5/6)